MSYLKLQANNAKVVSPTDSKLITINGRDTRGCVIYCGVTGDIAVKTTGGETVTFKNVPQGMVLPVQVVQVLATGTTATDLISLH